jgi:hypothetical protein
VQEGAQAVAQRGGGHGLAEVLAVRAGLLARPGHELPGVGHEAGHGAANVEVNSLHPPPAALDEHLEGQQLLDAEDHAILALHTNSRAANRAGREGSGEAWRAREREERRGANTF